MSNLTRLTLHNNSLTVMDRDLFQVGTLDYTTAHLAQSITQLTSTTGKGLIPAKCHTGHCDTFYTVLHKIFPLKMHDTLSCPPEYDVNKERCFHR